MEQLNSAIAAVLAWLAALIDPTWIHEGLQNLVRTRPLVLLGLSIVPVGLALLSRRPFGLLAVLLMVLFAGRAIVDPVTAAEWTAPAIYVASVLVATMQWLAARRFRRLQTELVALRVEFDRLRQTEQRRFIVDLKTSNQTTTSPDVAGNEPISSG